MYIGWHCVIEYGSEKANYIYYFIFSLTLPPVFLSRMVPTRIITDRDSDLVLLIS